MKKLKLFITLIMVAIITVCNTACTDNTQKGNNPTIPVTKGTDGLEYTLSDDGKYAICTGLGSADESTITISSHYDGVVVEEIKSSAFSDKDSIEKLIIPDGVKKIGRRAFLGCDNLVSLTLPTTLAEIATEAFYSCEKLYLVNNHSNLNIMRWSGENGFVAYYACKVYDAETETIGHIKTEGDYVTFSFDEEKYIVAYNGNESVPVIPSDVTGINSFAFYQNTNVTKLKIPSNLKAIGAYAFWGNTLLKQVTFEENCSL